MPEDTQIRGDGIAHPAIFAKTPTSEPNRSYPVWFSYSKYKRLIESADKICKMYNLLDDAMELWIDTTTQRDIRLEILLQWYGPYGNQKLQSDTICCIDWGDDSPEVCWQKGVNTNVTHDYAGHRNYKILIHGERVTWNQQAYPSVWDQNYDFTYLSRALLEIHVPPGRNSIIRRTIRGFGSNYFKKLRYVDPRLYDYLEPRPDNSFVEMFDGCSALTVAPRLWEMYPDIPHEHCFRGTQVPDVPDDWK